MIKHSPVRPFFHLGFTFRSQRKRKGQCSWMALFAGVFLIVSQGCSSNDGSPSLGTMTGTVTLDGEPLPDAFIEFTPTQGRVSWGKTNAEGMYHLDYTNSKPGALLGEHKVEVSTYVMPSPDAPNSGKPELVPPQYNTETTLVTVVEEGSNTFDIDVKAGDWKAPGSASKPGRSVTGNAH